MRLASQGQTTAAPPCRRAAHRCRRRRSCANWRRNSWIQAALGLREGSQGCMPVSSAIVSRWRLRCSRVRLPCCPTGAPAAVCWSPRGSGGAGAVTTSGRCLASYLERIEGGVGSGGGLGERAVPPPPPPPPLAASPPKLTSLAAGTPPPIGDHPAPSRALQAPQVSRRRCRIPACPRSYNRCCPPPHRLGPLPRLYSEGQEGRRLPRPLLPCRLSAAAGGSLSLPSCEFD